MGRFGRKKRENDVYLNDSALKKRRTTTNKDDTPLNITRIVKKTPLDITIDSDQENVEPEKQTIDEFAEKEMEEFEQQLALELEQERLEKEQLEKEQSESKKPYTEQDETKQDETEQEKTEQDKTEKDEADDLEQALEETQGSNADEINEQLRLDEELAKLLAKENEESEYEIEKIVNHTIFKGKVVQYEIKWKNYSDDDNTLEIASEIHNDVPALCEKYWDDLGIKRPTNAPGYGRPTGVDKKKASSTSKSKTLPVKPAPKKTAPVKEKKKPKADLVSMLDVPRCMAQKGYAFPISYPNKNTQWSEEIKEIETIQLSPIDNTVILVYLEWKNGQKTIHTLKEIHEKCPRNLIEYYEARLKFV
ncbi:hypothetical protein G6F56_010013 [Rhizopus delemar]|nr:hypothetical protein G6F56_010013 [Rhizopus delemar]